MKKKILALALLLVAGSSLTFADTYDLKSSDFYTSGSLGLAVNKYAKPAIAARLSTGYDINKYFSVELGSAFITKIGSDQWLSIYDVSAIYTLYFTDSFAVFGQAGLAYQNPGALSAEKSMKEPKRVDGGWDVLGALGVRFDFTPNFAMTAGDYLYAGTQAPQGSLTNFTLVGLRYNY